MEIQETKPYKVIYSYYDEITGEEETLDFIVFAKTLIDIEETLVKNNVVGGYVHSITKLPGTTTLF